MTVGLTLSPERYRIVDADGTTIDLPPGTDHGTAIARLRAWEAAVRQAATLCTVAIDGDGHERCEPIAL